MSNLNLKTRNKNMNHGTSFTELQEKILELNESRNDILKDIEDSQNEILSISERIQELQDIKEDTKWWKDQITKAKDKRKRIREQISLLNHEVRTVDALKNSVELELKHTEYYQS